MRRFVYKQEYVRPEATRVSDGVVVRLEHVYEVDPDLMGQQFDQQNMPLWDTLRIVESRNDHLNWMHEHFADETLVAGKEPELDLGPGQPSGEAYPSAAGGAGAAPKANPPVLTLCPPCLSHHRVDDDGVVRGRGWVTSSARAEAVQSENLAIVETVDRSAKRDRRSSQRSSWEKGNDAGRR